jgi:hypothetical protein
MDERIFTCNPGQPIPPWDLAHRLRTDKSVGPECKDTATIFRINSTFMDVADQPYRYRQMLAGGVLVAFLFAVACLYIAGIIFVRPNNRLDGGLVFLCSVIFTCIAGFGYIAFRAGRDEFFALKRRPIRFNRKEQKIYTIRRRRFFAKPGQGDVTWEVPWNADSIFCIHKSKKASDDAYHIRHYEVDAQGNVVRAFAIGRQWEGPEELEGLLSQWNYWCEYMNHGPANLPSPSLFFDERESLRDSFLFCTYGLGFGQYFLLYIIMSPFIVMLTIFRVLALWTCRDPVWPQVVEAVSQIEPGDLHEQPRGATPVGWAQTGMACHRQEWPMDPKREVANWQGDRDPVRNGLLWAEDVPPSLH